VVTAGVVVGAAAVAAVASNEHAYALVRASEGILDPLQEQAVAVFAGLLAADRVSSIRAIRAQLHVGQPRAQRVGDHVIR
jgi:hypothetical protein